MTSPSTPAPVQRQAFLITSRFFPTDMVQLEPVLNKMYIEVAQAVNQRTIGTFDKIQAVTGENWYNDANPLQKKQSYRKVFSFEAIAAGATLTFNHDIQGIVQLTRAYGTCITVTPDFRPIPYASATAVNTQIELNVTLTQINIINGAGAPNIQSGIIVLEYLLN